MYRNDSRTVQEAYSTAGNSSNLRLCVREGASRSDADLLVAAGWSRSRVGGALLRLHSEYDGPTIRHAAVRHAPCFAQGPVARRGATPRAPACPGARPAEDAAASARATGRAGDSLAHRCAAFRGYRSAVLVVAADVFGVRRPQVRVRAGYGAAFIQGMQGVRRHGPFPRAAWRGGSPHGQFHRRLRAPGTPIHRKSLAFHQKLN